MIIYGDGAQTKDFIYIDDLIQALIRTATYQNPQHSVPPALSPDVRFLH